ncbi:MAG: zinc ribbon domain-containing protein [Oscillospiraceae bacterium]|nr:zinc ribbon domain-containing protein [Oscillospiraceae bacterium]
MFCPKCGENNPDGARFCGKCGGELLVQQQQPYPNMGQQQYPGTGQQQYPGTGQQQYPGMGQQQYPGAGQPIYAGYTQMPPKKRSAAVPIAIICGAAAAVAVFLVLLFTVILPSQPNETTGQSIESRLNHRWEYTLGSYTDIIDFRNNTVEVNGAVTPITWELKGDDIFVVTSPYTTVEFSFSISSDGREMTVRNLDLANPPSLKYKRAD